MNILFSIHLYPPKHNCGSEYVAHHLAKYLLTHGHHVRVILHQDKMHNVKTPYIYEGVEVFGHTGELDAYRWADVILTHLDFTQFTMIQGSLVQKPVVHFVHNDIPYNSILTAFRGLGIVYNSQWIADKLNYKWPGVVLRPPCDPKDYEVETTRETITLISLNKNKGGDMAYDLARLLPDHKFQFVIGSYDHQHVEYDLDNVEIVPNSPDIKKVYARTRILIMPSQYESWGRTATEAMCSGIPVICTPTPGLKENCGNAAIYVGQPLEDTEPGEPQVHRGTARSWAAAIKRLDNEKEYKKYSVLCRQRAQQLNPVSDLEAVHQFLLKMAANGY